MKSLDLVRGKDTVEHRPEKELCEVEQCNEGEDTQTLRTPGHRRAQERTGRRCECYGLYRKP